MNEIISFLLDLERKGYATPSLEIGIRRGGFLIRIDGLKKFKSDGPGVGPRIVRRDCTFTREESAFAEARLRQAMDAGLPERDIYGHKDEPSPDAPKGGET